MRLQREFNLDGNKEYWALKPESVTETAICHLLSKEYPALFEFASEIILGGIKEVVYLKIRSIDKIKEYL